MSLWLVEGEVAVLTNIIDGGMRLPLVCDSSVSKQVLSLLSRVWSRCCFEMSKYSARALKTKSYSLLLLLDKTGNSAIMSRTPLYWGWYFTWPGSFSVCFDEEFR